VVASKKPTKKKKAKKVAKRAAKALASKKAAASKKRATKSKAAAKKSKKTATKKTGKAAKRSAAKKPAKKVVKKAAKKAQAKKPASTPKPATVVKKAVAKPKTAVAKSVAAAKPAAARSRENIYYITTAINYPNGLPHIGHAYEAIATDALARFQRLDGKDVFFLTGTDEHGLKMVQTAELEKLPIMEVATRNAQRFKDMDERLNISFDRFIRTTAEHQHRSSQATW